MADKVNPAAGGSAPHSTKAILVPMGKDMDENDDICFCRLKRIAPAPSEDQK